MSEWYQKAKEILNDSTYKDWDIFLISLVQEFNKHKNLPLVQDITIRALERKNEIESSFILEHILGELGLFPYVTESQSAKDIFRASLFATPQDAEKVFHIRQAEVFHRIMSGENVILSAPTSFGKSLIIEAIIASKIFNNIVIVVPTIALIEELTKKLFKYKDYYKLITQVSQECEDKNIFIFTQERVLEYRDDIPVDFFIIDEFYKLAPTNTNDTRCDSLNLAFRLLHKKCNRFYMLGPRINGLIEGVEDILRCTFLQFDSYATVATNEHFYPLITTGRDADIDIERDQHLKSILTKIGRSEQTVIYCKSPQRAASLMSRLLDFGILSSNELNNALSSWLADNFHKDWSLVKGVKYGVAYHHAQLPRAVSSLFVDLFNESKINILICTSTLIEGVNTNAKNIIIYDDCITGRIKLDMFTFNNISGRSGRMFEHYVGNVFIFGAKPQHELPFIDVPIITQSENASESLLLQLGSDLKPNNKSRVQKYYDQNILPLSLILKHQGLDPDRLLEFADNLILNLKSWNKLMLWDSMYPTYKELLHLSEIIFKPFQVNTLANRAVTSPSQLQLKLNQIQKKVDDKVLIQGDYDYWSEHRDYSIDDAVQNIFNFKKNLVGYNLPRILYAVNDIQEVIFQRYDYSFGNYKSFIAALENFYGPASIKALEEFGIPSQVTKKIIDKSDIEDVDNIDMMLSFLESSQKDFYPYLSDYEYQFIERFISNL